MAVLVCVTLDGTLVDVIYHGPHQRVEEVREYRWCQDGPHRSLWVRQFRRVEGAAGPVNESERRLWQNDEAPSSGAEWGGG